MADIKLFVTVFFLSAFAGLASLLRSETNLTILSIGTAMLNGGLFGLGICLFFFKQMVGNVYALVGSALLSGLGGAGLMDFVTTVFRRGKV